MTENAPLVTIIGGSGFVGRYIAQNMARRGWRVRVACRRPNEAMFVKPYGVVGQVEPVQCNVRDEASVARVIAGAEVVVYSVGVLFESGANRFEAVQAEGPARAARLAKAAGAARFVLISAIGADPESPSEYARTKAAGEAGVRAAFPEAVVLRPSVVFGPEDGFFNRFAAMARLSPVVPVVGAETRFQPVWVQDVADAAARAVVGEAEPGVYELGGPRIYSFRELVALTLKVIRRRRLIADVPFFIGRLKGKVLSLLPNPPLTEDQVRLLERDNVVAEGARGFEALGIQPKAAEGIIETYLYPYRPYGQYSRLTENGQA
ncbi:complex I NDUFA9 subunit family protein [Limibaculum sp. M0105]|uniref:Complex I NDUFA9 subunit family protein n=1 Tax=Thermohalobaculum xanthum TaxID=2753746 RepID=A0A8J7SG36_9RHOB|nr:complex I NDUFA9 subunit family protein [Thermohalobaculum xanthum]MBK0400561.1 complex I NDUFA9 subunit family protein [Thermohalobaculum xanthum]